MAQVTQETILFNDTVRNNIAYGQPDVKPALVEQAARNALAHDFILHMPQGYDTVIGEKGFRLSGGEKQRLAIARAILKNAPILILDEATSALDAESESLVQTALANLMQDRTVMVIAHRLSTIRRANRIAVLEDGRITAIGSARGVARPPRPPIRGSTSCSSSICPRRRRPDPLSALSAFEPGCTRQQDDRSKNADFFDDRVCAGSGARAVGDEDQLSYTLTVKSVNHRFLDLQLRLPSGLDALEMELRKALKDNLVRGHVDFTLSVDRSTPTEGRLQSRAGLPVIWLLLMRRGEEHSLKGEPDLNAALRMPGALAGREIAATTTSPRLP